jgi:predicted MFS family arabinose efflux permease
VQLVARLNQHLRSYPPLLRLLALIQLLYVAGLSFVWPVTAVYIRQVMGHDLTVAGLVLFLHSGASALGNLAGGWLFDRIGARPVVVLGMGAAGALMAVPGLVTSWPLYVAVMVLFGFAVAMPFPAVNALAARTWPAGGRRAFNFIYVAHNAGVALGTALGGILAARSFSLAFLGAGSISLGAALLVLLFVREPGPVAGTGRAEVAAARDGGGVPIPWVPVLALLSGLLVAWVVYVQWQGPLAVHMQALGIGLPAYSALWTINGAVIVVGQPLLALALRHVSSLTGQLLLGTLLYGGAMGLLVGSHAYPFFVAGMVVLTFGEMLIWPGVPAAIDQVAPPERRGLLQGAVGSVSAAGRMVGPLVGGLFYDHLGFGALVLGMLALLAVPLAAFWWYGRFRRA